MNRCAPHNAQTILDLSQDESYLYVKNSSIGYNEILEGIYNQLSDIDGEELPRFFKQRKRLKRKVISRLNRAIKALQEVSAELWSEQYTIENRIINDALHAPIAPRKVNLMTVQSDVDISINDNPEYSEKVYNPCRSDWMQAKEGIKK